MRSVITDRLDKGVERSRCICSDRDPEMRKSIIHFIVIPEGHSVARVERVVVVHGAISALVHFTVSR